MGGSSNGGRPSARLKWGIYLPNQGPFADVRVLAGLAVAADDAGWDGFFIWDALVPIFEHSDPVREKLGTSRAIADSVVALTAIGAATRRVRFGSLVAPLPRLRPETFAQQMATIDRISGGRLVVGAGLGSPDAQFTSFGLDADLRRRAAMADEFLDVATKLWSGEPVEHRGPHYTVTGIQEEAWGRPAWPERRGRPPVWIAGGARSAAPRRRAARWDGFVPASDGWPDEVISADDYRSMAADIAALRPGAGLDGYDLVVIGNADGTRPSADDLPGYVDAGATWVLAQAFSVEDAQARITAGPPAIR